MKQLRSAAILLTALCAPSILPACGGGQESDGAGGTAAAGGVDGGSTGGSSADGSGGGGSGAAGSGAAGSGGSAASGTGASAGTTGRPPVDYPDASFVYNQPVETTDACASVAGEATLEKKPVDIIISIDNSGSMTEEINAVQDRINDDFYRVMQGSGLDYRVIMVSRYGNVDTAVGGSNHPVCIGPATQTDAGSVGPGLGVASCPDGNYPALELNPPVYYHHSADIESRNMWCRLIESYDQADEVGTNLGAHASSQFTGWTSVAPNGWQDWLRADSFKVFIGITDDSTGANGCDTYPDTEQGAIDFDVALRTLAPQHFGAYDGALTQAENDANRNYAWYSIVGLDSPGAVEPTEDIVTGSPCSDSGNDGVTVGTAYQWLSKMTGGLRYSSCLTQNFNAVFERIAEGAVESATVACDFAIPSPQGQTINPEDIVVRYTAGGGGGAPVEFGRASGGDAGACTGEQFYYEPDDTNPTRIVLCPAACSVVQADTAGQIAIDFGCLGS